MYHLWEIYHTHAELLEYADDPCEYVDRLFPHDNSIKKFNSPLQGI
ncbi:hypothetical protein HRM2_15960 [Desulforapulum autotrophicum HRM2]|uniref:Uncharacterized protein n=1 Tax=Desulforapulum autotrophicum (strain ATCC 43914 / DSM 3382 / VKM B-1955 / HRM2) TaxID=177437 RepID=C0QAC0_DESAH|nr:hypothetical protein HRM2_15960 [Desulforapulum autotrophicum HRM2]